MEILSLVGSGALGAVLKVGAAVVQHRMEMSRLEHQQEHEKFLAHSQAQLEKSKLFYGSDAEHFQFTQWTRRVLALSLVWTFCAVLLLCAIWPGAEFAILNPAGVKSFSLFWGLVDIPLRSDMVVTITSGSIAYAALHLVTMVLGAYFMPTGKT